nr:MAG TPA: hypothetical protein [Caudoviricetes sp.]
MNLHARSLICAALPSPIRKAPCQIDRARILFTF